MLHPVAETALIVFILIFGLTTVALLGVLAFSLVKLNKKIDELTTKVEPMIVKVTDAVENVQRVTMSVGEKADRILSRGETMTDSVSSNIEKTATIVQKAVTTPLINLSSFLSGVTKAASVYGHSATNGKSGHKAGE